MGLPHSWLHRLERSRTAWVRGVGAAASIALINSVGNIGGFVGPYLLGAISDATHSFTLGLFAIAAMLVIGAVLVLTVGDEATTSA